MKEFKNIKRRTFPHDLQFHALSCNLGLELVEKTFHNYVFNYEGDKSFYEYMENFTFEDFDMSKYKKDEHFIKISEEDFFKVDKCPVEDKESPLTPKAKELLKKYRKGYIWKDL